MKVMFERYKFKAVSVQIQAVLCLYSQGLDTGMVVDSGDGVTHIVPVYQATVLPHLVRRINIAGRHITQYLIKLLTRRGYAFNRTADFEPIRQMKEKLCYVSCNEDLDKKLALQTVTLVKSHTLPDGRPVKMNQERYEAPEALFQPSLIGIEAPGIAVEVFNCIQDADIDVRPELYKAIVLSGGTSMFPGLSMRLQKEIKAMYISRILQGDTSRQMKFPIRVVDLPRRKHMVFAGGAVLADIMKDNDAWWVTRSQYMQPVPVAANKGGSQASQGRKLW